ncbi:MAG: hypothetical protein IJW99_03820 [Clostridia bacterium]|nr:hypothetical protein [Clostridia bacterium]
MRLFKLFRTDPKSGEKIKLSGEDFAAQNPYHASVAREYHIAQLVLFSLLALFVILSMLIRSDDITYENFFYLFKDIHAAVDSENVTFTSLVYNADDAQDFDTYRGGLAVAGSSGLTVFSATGRQTLSRQWNMNAPRLHTSSRYILVYDQGGTDFYLFNAFSRIYSGKVKGNLTCAAVSDAGWLAVASQNGSSSVISVYDKYNHLKAEHFKNAFATALALDQKGNLLAIVTTDTLQGHYLTKIELYAAGTDTLLREWSFEGLFPLKCAFADNEILYLTGTDRMLILNTDGEILSDLSFTQKITKAHYSEQGYALNLSDGSLQIFDRNGELLGARDEGENIHSVLVGEDRIYMMSEGELMTYHRETGSSTSQTFDFSVHELLWYSEDELLLCSRSIARFLNLKS